MSAQPGRMEQFIERRHMDLALGAKDSILAFAREVDAEAEQQRALIAELAAALELIKSQDSGAWVAWLNERGVPVDGRPFEVIIADAALARVKGEAV